MAGDKRPRAPGIAGNELAIIMRPGQKRSLLQIPCRERAMAEKLTHQFGGTSRPLTHDWTQSQKPHTPIRVGRHLEIVGEPVKAPKSGGRTRLVIPAAGAFGTGEHATTAMSLRLLEEATRKLPPGWRLLDAGTGTGILALAARHLGAGEVMGLDNDPRAVAHARQNARLNRISRASFAHGDVLKWRPTSRYDIITANLFSELLIAALPRFRRALRGGGQLIISGILREQAAAVERALDRSGFQLRKKRRRGKWVALLAGL
ncbi:MAG: 50S ribosomal protein L11 methyltransferase [Chthoniobacterales bacterium]|nr:50S ribosomal protein L11 methyltransferase [Chthoniobacterales bacterium]